MLIFAKKYDLPIKVVIQPRDNGELKADRMTRAFIEQGVLVSSAQFDGLNNDEAIEEISQFLEQKKWGKRTVNYKLKDYYGRN